MARLIPEYRKRVKDAIVSVRNSSPIPGLGVAGGFKIMVEDRGGRGLTDLQTETDLLTRRLRSLPGLADVATGFRSNAPSIWLDIDRTKAVALGVAFEDVNQTLSMLLGSLYVNSFNQFGRHWQVTVQAEGEYRNRIEALNLFQVRNNRGEMVPLGTLVNVNQVKSDRGGPIVVTRYNLYTSASITGNMLPGFSSGDAIKAINAASHDSLPLVDEGGVDRADVRADPGGGKEPRVVRFRAGGGQRLPGSGGPVRKLGAAAGGDPGGADVSVVLGIGGALFGPGRQHFRADRAGGAGGAGVQERDPDRRIRQAEAPRGLVSASTRRERHAGCGCVRS